MSELPTVCTVLKPIARKEHKCCECRGVIKRGETYELIKGIWDGSASTFKTCADCASLRADVDNGLHNEDATPMGYLYESVMEGRGPHHVSRYLDIKRKRGAEIPEWMIRVETERKETNERTSKK